MTVPKRTVVYNKDRGFSLVELLMVMAIIAALAGVSMPAYSRYIDTTRSKRAMSEIHTISNEIAAYAIDHNGSLPPDGPPGPTTGLAAINRAGFKDPWGRPYVYVNIIDNPGGRTPLEDSIGNILNTDYDLYSVGPDGSSGPLAGAIGNADDIARHNNGGFVGFRDSIN
jgi:general secretion pathway protein G